MTNRAAKRKPAKASVITEEDLRERILRALNNKDYIARTVSGIAKEVHIAPRQVVDVIVHDKDLRMCVKVYPRRNGKGKLLLTTKRNFKEKASLKDKFIDFFSTNQVSLEDAS
jgi:hypothetical protein